MGERKVLNKYYPPDFDPSKLPRAKQRKNKQMNVRMMLPMSIQCSTCGNYIYQGSKFNSRKEDVVGEKYLGRIQIFRFYFKCTRCSAEITIKTDPKNSDYTVESGASRNHEPRRAEAEAVEGEKRKRAIEEMGDAMKSLENRTLDSKKAIDNVAALEEIISMKSRQARVSVDDMLCALQRAKEEKEKKSVEKYAALAKAIFSERNKNNIKRIPDEYTEDDDEPIIPMKKLKVSDQKATDGSTKGSVTESTTIKANESKGDHEFIIKTNVAAKISIKKPVPKEQDPLAVNSSAVLSLLQVYADDDDDDEES